MIAGREVVLRDPIDADADAVAAYWLDGDPEFIASLGIDPVRLPPREVIRKVHAECFARGAASHWTYIFGESQGRTIGYVALDRRSERDGRVHVHIFDRTPRNRAAVFKLFPTVLRLFLARFPLQKVSLETWPANDGIGRLLRRFGLVPRVLTLERPEGIARAGKFHLYELDRATVVALPN